MIELFNIIKIKKIMSKLCGIMSFLLNNLKIKKENWNNKTY